MGGLLSRFRRLPLPLIHTLAKFLMRYTKFKGKYVSNKKWAECQAIIGLAHYFKFVRRDPVVLEVADNFFRSLMADGNYSHWTLQAFWWYFQIAPQLDPAMVKYVRLSTQLVLKDVWSARDTDDTRLIGAKNGKLHSCTATSRNEGLISAYNIAKLTKNDADAKKLLRRIKQHLAFALQFQYGTTDHLLSRSKKHTRMADIFDLSGGVYNNPDETYIRIDFVAHHLRAIAGYLEIIQH